MHRRNQRPQKLFRNWKRGAATVMHRRNQRPQKLFRNWKRGAAIVMHRKNQRPQKLFVPKSCYIRDNNGEGHMRKRFLSTITVCALIVISCCTNAGAATNITLTDYLILQSIGGYHSSGKGKCGDGAGFLEAADHFSEDHNDATCRTGYYHVAQDLAISVQVSKHAGSNSDKWLLHEVEDSYRDNDNTAGRLGLLSGAGVKIREIGGNKYIYWGFGGG
jgi:hypothetical protein